MTILEFAVTPVRARSESIRGECHGAAIYAVREDVSPKDQAENIGSIRLTPISRDSLFFRIL
jgi:hypothetical protein